MADSTTDRRCASCAAPMSAGRHRNCAPCRYAAKESSQCGTCGQDRKLIARGMCGTCYSNTWRAVNGRVTTHYDIECLHCGKSAQVQKKSSRFCTNTCAQRNAAGWKHSTDLVRIRPPRAWFGAVIPSSTGFVSGPCSYCQQAFTAPRGSRYCSERCSNNASWMRRYRRRGQFAVSAATRLSVYERDGYQCQLCLNPVDMTIPTQERMGHTLDHIIPQSHQLVPDHSERNLRMAHRLCNSIRGDRVA